MGALKRTRPLKTVWLSPWETPDPPASFKRGVLGYAGAKDAFQKLTSRGVNEDLLWRHLWGLASLENRTKQESVPWYSLPGLPLHTLRRFPEQVRSWADDIERKEWLVGVPKFRKE